MKQREQREAGKKGQSSVGSKRCCGRRSLGSEVDSAGGALIYFNVAQDFRQGQSVHKERRFGPFPDLDLPVYQRLSDQAFHVQINNANGPAAAVQKEQKPAKKRKRKDSQPSTTAQLSDSVAQQHSSQSQELQNHELSNRPRGQQAARILTAVKQSAQQGEATRVNRAHTRKREILLLRHSDCEGCSPRYRMHL